MRKLYALLPGTRQFLASQLPTLPASSSASTAGGGGPLDPVSLRHLHQPHMLPFVDAFERWNARRQTDEYRALCESFEDDGSQTFDDVWMDFFARRVGKTGRWIVGLSELALNRRDAIYTYFTAKYKDITEIVVPLARQIVMSDRVPLEHRPEFFRSKGEHMTPLLYFPHTESIIKLVGVDSDPDALRGRASDGMVGSEVSFMKSIGGIGIEDTMRAVLLPQFQGRPWAFLSIETSAPKDPDHPVLMLFKPDCERRGAVCEGTIDVNTTMSEREKRKHLRVAGGRGHPTCEREYYNVTTRDAEQFVFPEFDRDVHVVKPGKVPRYALAHVSADPGSKDLFALVFGYWDFDRQKLVVQASWAKRNAGTRQVAVAIAFYEWVLWGRWPDARLAGMPMRKERGRVGWLDMLGDIATEQQCEQLKRMADAEGDDREPDKWRLQIPDGRLGHWDGTCVRQAPHTRVTDTDYRLIADMMTEFGYSFGNTAKDDADAQRSAMRSMLGGGKIEFWSTAGPVIDHVQHAIWNAKRTDYERHPIYGHYDCALALKYLIRNVLRDANPAVPAHKLVDPFTSAHVFQKPGKTREAEALERAFGGGSVVLPNRWR